jgi:hypothetical protein
MKATVLYRIASIVLILFAVGHTFGFLSFKPPTSEGRAVYEAMNKVSFQVNGATFSYGGFYRGFGLSASVNLVFSAFLAWHLGELARKMPQAIGAIGWMFFAVQVAGVALSLIYFSAIPAILSAVLTICVGWAAWLVTARPAH